MRSNRQYLLSNLFIWGLFFNLEMATAAIVNYDGGGDGTSWTDPLNWDCDCLPGPSDDPRIDGDYDVVIPAGSSITVDYIYLDKAASLLIGTNAILRCDQIFLDLNTEPQVENRGNIYCNKLTVRAGLFHNEASGKIKMINPLGTTSHLNNFALFINDGSMQIDNASGVFPIWNQNAYGIPHLINNGSILLTKGPQDGVFNQGRITNSGTLKISFVNSIGINSQAHIENELGGEILINNTGEAISNSDSLINNGIIKISQTGTGLGLSGGYLENSVGASIQISQSSQGLNMLGSKCENHGVIATDDCASAIRHLSGIPGDSAVVNNYGTMSTSNSSNLSLLSNPDSWGYFTNHHCATLILDKDFSNFSNFSNFGWIKQEKGADLLLTNNGTMVNNGVIEDPGTEFKSKVNTNNGYILSQIKGTIDVGDVVMNALQGSGNGISVVDNLFAVLPEGPSVTAGAYNTGTNSWSVDCNSFGKRDVFVPLQISGCPVEYLKLSLELYVTQAVNITNSWTGAVSTNWHDAGNWNQGHVPLGCEYATIPAGKTVFITKNGTARGLQIQTNSTVSLTSGNILKLSGSDFYGVQIGGQLNIAGQLAIDNTKFAAIFCESASNLLISSAGEVHIADLNAATAHGIRNLAGGSITNRGKISFCTSPNSVHEALQNEGTFLNDATGAVHLDHVFLNTGSGASYINKGEMDLHAALLNKNAASFTNDFCATLKLSAELDNGSLFDNDGFLWQFFQGSNLNTGTIDNQGVIDDEFESFSGLLTSNNGYYLDTKDGQFEVDFPATYLFNNPAVDLTVSGFFFDSLLCASAGDYAKSSDSWVPDSIAQDGTRFYFSITYNNSCAQTFSLQLTTPVSDNFCPSGLNILFPKSFSIDRDWSQSGTWENNILPDYCQDVSIGDPMSGKIYISPGNIARCNTLEVLKINNDVREFEVQLGGILEVVAKQP